MMRLVVTGTGRCGTGSASLALRAAGIDAGHEAVFGPGGVNPDTLARLEADCSWMAAPFLDALPSSVAVVHLVRDPLAVVRSLVGIGFYGDRDHGAYRRFADRYCPTDGDPVTRAMQFVVGWHRLIGDRPTVRVEDIADVRPLAVAGGWDVSAPVPRDYNARRRADLTLADLPAGDDRDRLAALAERLGYG